MLQQQHAHFHVFNMKFFNISTNISPQHFLSSLSLQRHCCNTIAATLLLLFHCINELLPLHWLKQYCCCHYATQTDSCKSLLLPAPASHKKSQKLKRKTKIKNIETSTKKVMQCVAADFARNLPLKQKYVLCALHCWCLQRTRATLLLATFRSRLYCRHLLLLFMFAFTSAFVVVCLLSFHTLSASSIVAGFRCLLLPLIMICMQHANQTLAISRAFNGRAIMICEVLKCWSLLLLLHVINVAF